MAWSWWKADGDKLVGLLGQKTYDKIVASETDVMCADRELRRLQKRREKLLAKALMTLLAKQEKEAGAK